MANIIHVNSLFLLRKRCYGVVAESLSLDMKDTKMKANAASDNGNSNKDKIFWMRDPKSGNWIPENHIGDVDAAELRDKFLPNTHKTSQST